jgi:hypothetical protein
MHIQLRGGIAGMAILLCPVSLVLPYSSSLMGPLFPILTLLGNTAFVKQCVAIPDHGTIQRVWDAVPTSKKRFSATTSKVFIEYLWD